RYTALRSHVLSTPPPWSYITSVFSAFTLYILSTFFFSNATPPPALYTLSLHDALPISATRSQIANSVSRSWVTMNTVSPRLCCRSEEHTSELQSRGHLVCRLLLEKKKKADS